MTADWLSRSLALPLFARMRSAKDGISILVTMASTVEESIGAGPLIARLHDRSHDCLRLQRSAARGATLRSTLLRPNRTAEY